MWMEVIKLRIAGDEPESVERKVVKLIMEVNHNGKMKEVKVYRHALLDNDLSIHLHWDSDNAEPQGSATGLCLLHLLKEFGLVSHSVWVDGNEHRSSQNHNKDMWGGNQEVLL